MIYRLAPAPLLGAQTVTFCTEIKGTPRESALVLESENFSNPSHGNPLGGHPELP
jgi:hypothetical protein